MASMVCLLLSAALAACSGTEDRERARSIDAVNRQHSQVWSKGNTDLIPEIYAEDFIGHAPGGRRIEGRAGIRKTVEDHRAAFPDWHEEVELLLVDGDFIVTKFRSTGTHRGRFLEYPATGRRIEITETCIYRMVEGRIAEQWMYPDVASLRKQLAPVPRP